MLSWTLIFFIVTSPVGQPGRHEERFVVPGMRGVEHCAERLREIQRSLRPGQRLVRPFCIQQEGAYLT